MNPPQPAVGVYHPQAPSAPEGYYPQAYGAQGQYSQAYGAPEGQLYPLQDRSNFCINNEKE